MVYKEAYPTGTKDFAAMIEAMKARNPDVLIAAGYTGDMIVLARQTSEQKVPLKMIGFTLGPTLPGFVEALGTPRREYPRAGAVDLRSALEGRDLRLDREGLRRAVPRKDRP